MQTIVSRAFSGYRELMAGQPKTREMMKKIEGAGGPEWLLRQVAEGRTLISLAAELDVSRSIISGLLNDEHGDALREARRRAASVLAEESKQIADDATPETERVAKLKIDTRRWLSSKWDRSGYGEQVPAAAQVSISALFLSSLRHVNAETNQQYSGVVTQALGA